MTVAEQVLAVARAELGVKEATDRNDGVPAERYSGGRVGEPWCANFVAWCFRRAGRALPLDVEPTLTVANPLCSVAAMYRMFVAQGWLYRAPSVGDVVLFETRGASDKGPGHHCGIVEVVKRATVTTIEGNTGNEVKRIVYLRARMDTKVMGYGRVPDPRSPPG